MHAPVSLYCSKCKVSPAALLSSLLYPITIIIIIIIIIINHFSDPDSPFTPTVVTTGASFPAA